MPTVFTNSSSHDATVRLSRSAKTGKVVGEYTGHVVTSAQLNKLRKDPAYTDIYVLGLPQQGKTARKYLDGNTDDNLLKHIRFANWSLRVNCILDPTERNTFACRLVCDLEEGAELFAQPLDGPPAKTVWEAEAEHQVACLQYATRQYGIDALSSAAGIIEVQDRLDNIERANLVSRIDDLERTLRSSRDKNRFFESRVCALETVVEHLQLERQSRKR